LSYLKQ